jgi:phosphate transport system substrate-binding protein
MAAALLLTLLSTVGKAGEFSIVGTGAGRDIIQAISVAYMWTHPETRISVPPSVGSGGGITRVGADQDVLGRIRARPLTEAEAAAGLHATPVFWLPSAFFVHPAVGVDDLTNRQVSDIYAGKVTNWSEVGGPDLKIKVIVGKIVMVHSAPYAPPCAVGQT